MTAPASRRPLPSARPLADKLAELATRAPAEYSALVTLTDAILRRLGPATVRRVPRGRLAPT